MILLEIHDVAWVDSAANRTSKVGLSLYWNILYYIVSVNVSSKGWNWNTEPDHTEYTGCPGGDVPDFGRMFLTLKYTDITQNIYIRSWTVTEIMAREKCGLLAVPRTVPVSNVITRTLRMPVLQSRSRVKHIPPSLSTDVAVTVNCNSILLDMLVPCKVFGTLRTTTLVRIYVV